MQMHNSKSVENVYLRHENKTFANDEKTTIHFICLGVAMHKLCNYAKCRCCDNNL